MSEYPWLKKHLALVTIRSFVGGELAREETRRRTVYPPTETSIYPLINRRGKRRTVVPRGGFPLSYEAEEHLP